jgi:hypothetical protein
MSAERRMTKRVFFERPEMLAIDGTWRRECSMYDV